MSAGEKILIIDDEESIRLFTKANLEEEGYQVETAADAQDAMDKIAKTRPDLIILDILMPGPNGLQFCRVLKDDEQTSSIPVIMYTGQDTKPYKFKGEVSGADAYVVKSEDFSELIKKVKRLLDKKRRQSHG